MTDLPTPAPDGVSVSAAERLAALRTPSKKKGRPAHASKILAAGLSTTAMFGLVTAMGWPARTAAGQADAAPPTALVPVTPAPAPTVAPLVPASPLPASVPPVTIPVAVPVAEVPVQIAVVATDSNITTKTSG